MTTYNHRMIEYAEPMNRARFGQNKTSTRIPPQRAMYFKYATIIKAFLAGLTADALRIRLLQAAEERSMTLDEYLDYQQVNIILALKDNRSHLILVYPPFGTSLELARWSTRLLCIVLRASNCLSVREQDDVIYLTKVYRRYFSALQNNGGVGTIMKKGTLAKREWIKLCAAVQRMVEVTEEPALVKEVRNFICKVAMETRTLESREETQFRLESMVTELIRDNPRSKHRGENLTDEAKVKQMVKRQLSNLTAKRRAWNSRRSSTAGAKLSIIRESDEKRNKRTQELRTAICRPTTADDRLYVSQTKENGSQRDRSSVLRVFETMGLGNEQVSTRKTGELQPKYINFTDRKTIDARKRPVSAKARNIGVIRSKQHDRIRPQSAEGRLKSTNMNISGDKILEFAGQHNKSPYCNIAAMKIPQSATDRNKCMRSRSIRSKRTMSRLQRNQRPLTPRDMNKAAAKETNASFFKEAIGHCENSNIGLNKLDIADTETKFEHATVIGSLKQTGSSTKQSKLQRKTSHASLKNIRPLSSQSKGRQRPYFSNSAKQASGRHAQNHVQKQTDKVIQIPTAGSDVVELGNKEHVETGRHIHRKLETIAKTVEEIREQEQVSKQGNRKTYLTGEQKSETDEVCPGAIAKTKENDKRTGIEEQTEVVTKEHKRNDKRKVFDDTMKKIANEVLVHQQILAAAKNPLLQDKEFVDEFFSFLEKNQVMKKFLRTQSTEPQLSWKLPDGSCVQFSFFLAFVFRHIGDKHAAKVSYVVEKMLLRMKCKHTTKNRNDEQSRAGNGIPVYYSNRNDILHDNEPTTSSEKTPRERSFTSIQRSRLSQNRPSSVKIRNKHGHNSTEKSEIKTISTPSSAKGRDKIQTQITLTSSVEKSDINHLSTSTSSKGRGELKTPSTTRLFTERSLTAMGETWPPTSRLASPKSGRSRSQSRDQTVTGNKTPELQRSTSITDYQCWKCLQKDVALSACVNWRNNCLCDLLISEGVAFKEEHLGAAVKANDLEILTKIVTFMKEHDKWNACSEEAKNALFLAKKHKLKKMVVYLTEEGVTDDRLINQSRCTPCFIA